MVLLDERTTNTSQNGVRCYGQAMRLAPLAAIALASCTAAPAAVPVAANPPSTRGRCQDNGAGLRSALPCRNQATAAAHAASASARKRRSVGLLIKWRWSLKVL